MKLWNVYCWIHRIYSVIFVLECFDLFLLRHIWDVYLSIFFLILHFCRCQHYRRRCRIRAPCCNEVYDCRHCHNEAAVIMHTISVVCYPPKTLVLIKLNLLWISACYSSIVLIKLISWVVSLKQNSSLVNFHFIDR